MSRFCNPIYLAERSELNGYSELKDIKVDFSQGSVLGTV